MTHDRMPDTQGASRALSKPRAVARPDDAARHTSTTVALPRAKTVSNQTPSRVTERSIDAMALAMKSMTSTKASIASRRTATGRVRGHRAVTRSARVDGGIYK